MQRECFALAWSSAACPVAVTTNNYDKAVSPDIRNKFSPDSSGRARRKAWLLVGALLLFTGLTFLAHEIRHSRLQATHLARYAAELNYKVLEGTSDAIRFPAHGPFDQRMGYSELPRISERLSGQGFRLTHQARHSAALMDYTGRGYFAPYGEKASAGLTVADCRDESLYRFRYPYRGYADFAAVPSRVAEALMFIENRDLLDETRPTRNPAVDWVRFARAILGRIGRTVSDDIDAPGGSTLATQIEKYRHSPDGVTADADEKLRQMVSASVRAYRNGEETLPVRRQILLDYLNTVPLAAAPRHGEVNGLGDGLWVWFAADFTAVNDLLAAPDATGERLIAQGRGLRQVVALMIAHRRPSYYLGVSGRDALAQLSEAYLRLLAEHGIISAGLRDAALAEPLRFRDMAADPPLLPADAGKGALSLRNRLAGLLDASLYQLDRYDVRVEATLDGALQRQVSAFLGQLDDPAFARAQGLLGDRLLHPATLGKVRYSFNLVESTPAGNRVRVQTDTSDQALDINEGSKLELGSTAKLRVLTTYLEIVGELHERLVDLSPDELRKVPDERRDHLTRWAVEHLLAASDKSLPAMLQAALERRYSASPAEAFFTGGGVHTFGNFRREDDSREVTVREALQASINLPFVRLMRDIVRHTMYQSPDSSARLIESRDEARRQEYLARFADREGQVFLRRFWNKYQGRTAHEIRDDFLHGLRPGAGRLAAVFRYLSPESGQEELGDFLAARLPGGRPDDAQLARLYERNGPDAYDLPDRGFVARVHPLELWLVAYLTQHPGATWSEVVGASKAERQAVYRWLFNSRFKDAQDSRIFTMLEVEAFLDIHRRWARLGYPFGHLVPSLATALGSSGDRPAALAELMGIIVNDGMRLPTRRIKSLDFATGTPYETRFAQAEVPGERVLRPEVAAALRDALSEVVEGGTARRLSGAYRQADGVPLVVGGKTGTGDNRIVLGRGAGRGVALNRTATFVFYLGPRHFGTLTAYVIGADAARYRFTSTLPVQIVKSMGPLLLPALVAEERARCGDDGRPPAVADSKPDA